MNIKDEFLYDFALRMPRVLVSSNMAVLDNIKRISLISETLIVVGNGEFFTAVTGEDLKIKQLEDERMYVDGKIEKVEFQSTSKKTQD